jgi:Zn-dependent protease with chaperone function
MDFFAYQDRARRNTGLLLFYFIVAVLLIILAVNVVVYFFVAFFGEAQISSVPMERRLDSSVWLYISLGCLAVLCAGSLFRFLSLARGGSAVANMVNARHVDLATTEANERRYINVVEEMSIASGVPMPVLYVMDDEPGINAFVAGYQPTEAVMVVTRGALENLSRDELQGVVGHEFSHILNGDMRINIRLMAILAGILLIGKIGEILMRDSGIHGRGRNRGMLLGVGLFVVGYIGLFFGRLIKAAISRQREFLADASSVQFTRNPAGIAGALYKIQQNMTGSLLQSKQAEDMSHMCFGKTMVIRFNKLLATHPPLPERIHAIDPQFLKHQQGQEFLQSDEVAAVPQQAQGLAGGHGYCASASGLAESVGNPTPRHLQLAASIHTRIPTEMLEQLHTAQGAQAVIYAMVTKKMNRQRGLAFLQQEVPARLVTTIQVQLSVLESLHRKFWLTSVDLAIAALKSLPQVERDTFLDTLNRLIRLDNKVSLLEFVLLSVLQKHLGRDAERANPVQYNSYKQLGAEIRLIMSVLAHSSGQSTDKIKDALNRHMASFSSDGVEMADIKRLTVKALTEALQRLNRMPAVMKRSFLLSCADLVIDDGIVMPEEAELLRAIAELLDCPMPPLLLDADH